MARRDQAVYLAQERWRVASAELNRVLQLDPTTLVEPVEPPRLRIPLFDPKAEVEELIRVSLTHRPELKAHQALVQATLKQLQREKMRPLLPSVQLLGASTAGVLGTLPMSFFGGGLNSSINNFGMREDYDLQVIWTLQNLGFGNRALIRKQQVQNRLALLELYGIQNRVAADVVQAHAQVQKSLRRLQAAEREVQGAVASARENLKGFQQTRKVGELPMLIVRPQEVVAAIQALALAYGDFYGAVADFNRGQFRLYRALGNAATGVEGLLPSQSPPSETLSPSSPLIGR
ncbi:MAG: TolC family protein [Gemmataceae bacterium]